MNVKTIVLIVLTVYLVCYVKNRQGKNFCQMLNRWIDASPDEVRFRDRQRVQPGYEPTVTSSQKIGL